ncbi:MAG: thiosulfate oxidation carrier protein SoxY [Xanthomonadales bacterium]|nr:thiosulfate oxidation carrier protein SoxY [Xanthomonadales bacterium]
MTDLRANRRTFLQAGLVLVGSLAWWRPVRAAVGRTAAPGDAAGAAAGATPTAAAVARLDAALAATTAAEALQLLYGGAPIGASAAIALTVPSRVDNGANVPVAVAASLEGVRSIALVVERNPRPLAVLYEIPAATRPEIACRIKMAESGTLLALVDTADGVFSAAAEVTVTQGGCA